MWVFDYSIKMVLELIDHDVELELLRNGKLPAKEVKNLKDLQELSRRLNS